MKRRSVKKMHIRTGVSTISIEKLDAHDDVVISDTGEKIKSFDLQGGRYQCYEFQWTKKTMWKIVLETNEFQPAECDYIVLLGNLDLEPGVYRFCPVDDPERHNANPITLQTGSDGFFDCWCYHDEITVLTGAGATSKLAQSVEHATAAFKNLNTELLLQHIDENGKPNRVFWDVWRDHKQSMIDLGFSVKRNDVGAWIAEFNPKGVQR